MNNKKNKNIANILQGDVQKVLKKVPDNFYDGCFCDPPYGLRFMGKKWDYEVPKKECWEEVLRTLKPGAYLLAFGGTRTYHRLVCEIEDAGFEVKDCFNWLYGAGFPKSHNISLGLDKHFGGKNRGHAISSGSKIHPTTGIERPNGELLEAYKANNEQAKIWEGYGTALKPAYELILLAQKPREGTYAENCLKWGCGGLNIEETRIGLEEVYINTSDPGMWAEGLHGQAERMLERSGGIRTEGTVLPGLAGKNNKAWKPGLEKVSTHHAPSGTFAGGEEGRGSDITTYEEHVGRFPANLILDEESAKQLDEQVGIKKCVSRFFYCAKVSSKERNAGLEKLEDITLGKTENSTIGLNRVHQVKNNHPCCKPISLCQYLSRLILPPDIHDKNNIRKLLIPFAGSGSEMIGALLSSWDYIEGVEKEESYVKIARERIKYYE